jgi:hypothetical protein
MMMMMTMMIIMYDLCNFTYNYYIIYVIIIYYFIYNFTSDWVLVGRSEDRTPVGTRFSAPVLTGPWAHPASYTIGIVSLSRG